MAHRIVLSDASPLITLAVVCGLPGLKQLFGTVHLSSIVRDEVLTGAGLPGEKDIATAMRRGSLRVVEDRYAEPPFAGLDPGEASTLRWAVNVKRPALVLMDERAGRAQAAQLGVAVTGTAGIILAARQRGLIPSARVVFDRLLQIDFRISADLIAAVLRGAGEE
jgi:predicted nucleic acid-binding protein